MIEFIFVQYASNKEAIQSDLEQLRGVVTNMLNENRAAVDLEKLDEQEFNLDEEEMAEFRQRESDLVSSIQAEYAEKKQQAAEISAMITRNYWTEVETGPRMVKSFSGAMAIENFVIEEKKADKAVEFDAASETRKKQIEEEEIQAKKERKVGFTQSFALTYCYTV